MAICSECGKELMNMQFAVHRTDGGSSGEWVCTGCKRKKPWNIPGVSPQVIDMSGDKDGKK